MVIQDETEYSLTYKATNLAELWQGAVYFSSTRRLILSNIIICVLIALITAFCVSHSLAALLATFLATLIICALLLSFANLCAAFSYSLLVVVLGKLNLECKTVIDEVGIRDSLGPIKISYKWHQIRNLEMKDGNIYVISLFNGIQIPPSAFTNSSEAEEFFALAKQYKAQGHSSTQIAKKSDITAQDTAALLESMQEEEEAKWLEFENKHKEQNRE